VSRAEEVVRRHFESCDVGGLDALGELWHPDIEWRAVEGAADDVGPMRGHEAVRAYYEDWIDMLDELEADVDEVIFDDGERVAVLVRTTGRGRASGVRTEGRYYVACTVRDGRIANGREYETREQVLAAVEGRG
jgi:ketosteroid isomerase-like protein